MNIPKDIGEITFKVHSKGRFMHLKPSKLSKDVWVSIGEGNSYDIGFDSLDKAIKYFTVLFKEDK